MCRAEIARRKPEPTVSDKLQDRYQRTDAVACPEPVVVVPPHRVAPRVRGKPEQDTNDVTCFLTDRLRDPNIAVRARIDNLRDVGGLA